jgi:outer membrane protein assembly factor BamB
VGILWKVEIPLGGLGSPVVWKEHVFVSGATRDKRVVYCLKVADGSMVWTGTYESNPESATAYEVYSDLEDLMHAVPTPAVDGKRVYAMFANGEIAAFDMASGRALWSRYLGSTEENMYGLAGSLLIYKEDVIAQFDSDYSLLVRLDGETGSDVWSSERSDSTWASPILVKTSDGSYQVVVNGDPETSGWNPENGEQLWSRELVEGDIAPSPIYADGLIYVNFMDCGIFGIDPAGESDVAWTIEELEEGSISDSVSMVSDGEHVYQWYDGLLACIDAKTGDVTYEEWLDEDSSFASPMIIGDTLYLVSGKDTPVIKTGPVYERIATCKLEESSDVPPAVAGGKIFIRTKRHLYCLGNK